MITIENNAYVLRINEKIWTFVNYGQDSSFAFSRNVRSTANKYATYITPDEHVELGDSEITLFKARIDDFLLKKKQESEQQTQVLSAYTTADEVILPAHLDNIFVDPSHSDASLENLAISYSAISPEYRQGLQLFEVPKSDDNCQAYCGKGYGNQPCGDEWWEPKTSDGWVKLPNNTDFSCKKGFEKVFCYGEYGITHATRQWGDGTVLSKMGRTSYGATPVYRVTNPLHPSIKDSYGSIKSIWVRPYQNGEVPAPFFRGQSTFTGDGSVDFCRSSQSIDQVKARATLDWQTLSAELKNRRSAKVVQPNLEPSLNTAGTVNHVEETVTPVSPLADTSTSQRLDEPMSLQREEKKSDGHISPVKCKKIILLDVDFTLYYDRSITGKQQINDLLIQTLVESGLEDAEVYLFTSMSISELGSYGHPDAPFSRAHLIDYLESKGITIKGVITPADPFLDRILPQTQQNGVLGLAYEKLYKPILKERKDAGKPLDTNNYSRELLNFMFKELDWENSFHALEQARKQPHPAQIPALGLCLVDKNTKQPIEPLRFMHNVDEAEAFFSNQENREIFALDKRRDGSQLIDLSNHSTKNFTSTDLKGFMMEHVLQCSDLINPEDVTEIYYFDDASVFIKGAEEAVINHPKIKLYTCQVSKNFDIATNPVEKERYQACLNGVKTSPPPKHITPDTPKISPIQSDVKEEQISSSILWRFLTHPATIPVFLIVAGAAGLALGGIGMLGITTGLSMLGSQITVGIGTAFAITGIEVGLYNIDEQPMSTHLLLRFLAHPATLPVFLILSGAVGLAFGGAGMFGIATGLSMLSSEIVVGLSAAKVVTGAAFSIHRFFNAPKPDGEKASTPRVTLESCSTS